jgi:hypothetical protein
MRLAVSKNSFSVWGLLTDMIFIGCL